MTDDEASEVDGSAYRLRANLRQAGRHGAITAVLLGIVLVVWHLGRAFDLGLAVVPLAIVGVVCWLGGAANSYEAQMHLSKAAKIAWQMERARTIMAVALILLGVLTGAGGFVFFTAEPVKFTDEIQEAEDERQEALEAAAEADTSEEVQEHMETANAAESDAELFRLVNQFWRVFPTFVLATISLLSLAFGWFGLTTRPRTEVPQADV